MLNTKRLLGEVVSTNVKVIYPTEEWIDELIKRTLIKNGLSTSVYAFTALKHLSKELLNAVVVERTN